MRKYSIALNNGTLAGMLSFGLFVLYFFLGQNPLGAISWLSAWIPITFIGQTIKKFRIQEMEGYITYGQAFTQGLYFTLIWGSFMGMGIYLFGTFIDGNILTIHQKEMYEAYEMSKKFLGNNETLLESTLEEIRNMSIGKLAMSDIANKFTGGMLISLVWSYILKKNKPFFEESHA